MNHWRRLVQTWGSDMDIDLYCDCGRPTCKDHIQMRVGPVFFSSADGTEHSEDDWFHVDSFNIEDGKDTVWTQLMVNSKNARKVLWLLRFEYSLPWRALDWLLTNYYLRWFTEPIRLRLYKKLMG